MKKIGLIAGSGKFPLLFAQKAKEKNVQVVAVAFLANTDKAIRKYVSKLYWIKVGELRKIIDIFKEENITSAVMAGQINPRSLFDKRLYKDKDSRQLLQEVKDLRADTIFKTLIKRFEKENIRFLDSTLYLSELLVKRGVLTKRAPSTSEWEDINFGFSLAKAVAELDIGRTLVVKNKAILAVEAIEGTDSAIKRAAKFSKECVVIKVSRPKQDMRFDVPVIGLRTIYTLLKTKARCLALEAGKTIFIDQEKCIFLANQSKLSIVAL